MKCYSDELFKMLNLDLKMSYFVMRVLQRLEI